MCFSFILGSSLVIVLKFVNQDVLSLNLLTKKLPEHTVLFKYTVLCCVSTVVYIRLSYMAYCDLSDIFFILCFFMGDYN